MKKILALLLALLLPVAAFAEASTLEMSVTMDVENAASIFKSMGMFNGATNEEELCRLFAELVDGFRMRLLTQDDATRFEMSFDETTLLDLSVLYGGENLIFTSDMMGGTGLSMPMALLNPEHDEFLTLLADTDWEGLLGGMAMAVMQQIDAVEITETRGSYSGAAYEGGVYAINVTLDDKVIAGLLNAMLTEEVRALIGKMAAYWDMDGESLLAQIDAVNAEAAADNAHRYIIRVVYDEAMNLIGLSVTVMQGEKQLCALSIGVDEAQLRIVAGFGLDDVNYWHYQEINWQETAAEDGKVSLRFWGEILEFTAPKASDFAFAIKTYTDFNMLRQWEMNVTTQGNGATWRYTVSEQMGLGAPTVRQDGKGMYMPGVRFANSCTYSWNAVEYMIEQVIWGPCDPISADGAGMELLDIMSEDVTKLQEVALTLGEEIATRLLQVMPMQLLLYFQ